MSLKLRSILLNAGVIGSITLYDSHNGRLESSDALRYSTRYSPASTFKIANSIIGLETGLLTKNTKFPWDGQRYSVAAWNQEHTLSSAMGVSCVPCFQQLARRTGSDRMSSWLHKLQYGNGEIGGGIDQFWLDGGLEITPLEQLQFLRRLDQHKLPIRESTRETLINIITVTETNSYALRAKTGLTASGIGWFVGWLELGPRRIYFATVLLREGSTNDVAQARKEVTLKILSDLTGLPIQ